MNSIFEIVKGELHAKLVVDPAMRDARPTGCGRAWLWCRWVVVGLAGHRVDAPSHAVHQAPPVWRAPKGPEGLAAVPVGGGRAWPQHPRVTAITTPAKVAHNFRRSFFKTAQKRCNSNEVISMFEQVARELRAKLMGERPVGRQAASRRRVCPVNGRSAARGPHAASHRRVCPVSGRSAARGPHAASHRRACPVSARSVPA